jgi:hypothetical protein
MQGLPWQEGASPALGRAFLVAMTFGTPFERGRHYETPALAAAQGFPGNDLPPFVILSEAKDLGAEDRLLVAGRLPRRGASLRNASFSEADKGCPRQEGVSPAVGRTFLVAMTFGIGVACNAYTPAERGFHYEVGTPPLPHYKDLGAAGPPLAAGRLPRRGASLR